ncbi:MAG: aldo/keto reductase [Chloroflexi bacterium]|nr:aldo/keto reductase [Chloroflexota bacterium]
MGANDHAATAVRRRRLGRAGLEVPEMGLGGAWLLGRRGDLPVEHGVATIRRALDLGITYLDTAECYIGGRSEAVFGAALDGYDGEYVLATKCGHRPRDFDWSSASVLASIQQSLRLLRRPSVDLLQLHTPTEPPLEAIFGAGGALEGLHEARERGWCRFLGITGRNLDFLRRCVESDAFDTLLVFQRFDLLEQSAQPLFEAARAHDMGIILGSPLRLGLFGSARDEVLGRYPEEDRAQVAALESLFADEPGGISTGALRFALTPSEVSVVLSGAASPEEIENSVAVVRTPIAPHIVDEVYGLGGGKVRVL